MHPRRNSFTDVLFESGAESAVAAVSALKSQLLCGDNTLLCRRLTVKTHEMIHPQAVDVSVIGEPLLGKVLAKIITVCAKYLNIVSCGYK